MLSEFEKDYLLEMVNKEDRQSKLNYERGYTKKGTPLEQMVSLYNKANAKETVKKIIEYIFNNKLEDEILNECSIHSDVKESD